MSLFAIKQTLMRSMHDCTLCGKCMHRCEVLSRPDDVVQGSAPLTVGALVNVFGELFAGLNDEQLATPEGEAELFAAVNCVAQTRPDLVFAVRRCCMCSYCTQVCGVGVDARATFASLRELFTLSQVVTGEGFESTQVDTEWHIFSVYRAVYGVHYQDLPHLSEAREQGADTLFFPGCPLASYAPDLTREVYGWLADQGVKAVFSEDCCGSPLKAAGRMERAAAYKRNFATALQEAGIKRVVCVCPGCAEELAEAEGMQGIEMVPLPRLLAEAGVRIGVESSARVAVFDSCHDRGGFFGGSLRTLFSPEVLRELPRCKEQAQCCGASGAVSLVDPDLCARRTHRVLDEEATEAQASLLVANCPTCSYTFAAQRRADVLAGLTWPGPAHINYLELVFESSFDWSTIFSQLEGMWSGEYGAWVCQQLS